MQVHRRGHTLEEKELRALLAVALVRRQLPNCGARRAPHDAAMHDPDLSSGPAAARLTRHRRPVSVADFEGLFLLLARLRAANAESLLALFFAKRGVPERTAMRRLAWLVERGFLRHQRFFDSTRALYFLSARAAAVFSSVKKLVHTSTAFQPPAPRQAAFCWLRAMLHAALVRDGFTIGRGIEEQKLLRRLLVDRVRADLAAELRREPNRNRGGSSDLERTLAELRVLEAITPMYRWHCSTCGWRSDVWDAYADRCRRCKRSVERRFSERRLRCVGCGLLDDEEHFHKAKSGGSCRGRFVDVDPLAFDVAWRRVGNGVELFVVIVDDPSRSVDSQLKELGYVRGAPKFPVLLRTADLDSIYNATTGKWEAVGARHRDLRRATNPKAHFRSRVGCFDNIELVDYRPELQLHVIR
jgi:hypothetical protein